MTIEIPVGGYYSIFDNLVIPGLRQYIDTLDFPGILTVEELNSQLIPLDLDNDDTADVSITAFEAARLLRDYGDYSSIDGVPLNNLDYDYGEKGSINMATGNFTFSNLSTDHLYSYVNNNLGGQKIPTGELLNDVEAAYNFAKDNYVLAYHDYSIFDLVDYFEQGTYAQLLKKANALIDDSSDFDILNNLGNEIFSDGIVTRAEYEYLVGGERGFAEHSGLG